jgi:hypothetical protein
MKIGALLIMLSVTILACSISDIPILVKPTITAAPTLPPPPTNTATQATPPTYTPTPTLIGMLPSATLFESPTPYGAIASYTPTIDPSSLVTDTTPTSSILQGTGFNSIDLSTDLFHWGSCDTTTVTITAQVSDPSAVNSVVLFSRFTRKSTGNSTGWDSGTTLDNQGDGKFAVTLDGNQMGVYYEAWLEYQLVGTDTNAKNAARSPVFPSLLTLAGCP